MKKTAQPRLLCAVSSQMAAAAGLRLPAYFHPHGRAARRAHAHRSSVRPEALRRAGAPRFRPCRRVRQAAGGVPQGKSATLCLGKGKKNGGSLFLSAHLLYLCPIRHRRMTGPFIFLTHPNNATHEETADICHGRRPLPRHGGTARGRSRRQRPAQEGMSV